MKTQRQLAAEIVERAGALLSTLESAWEAKQITAPKYVQCQLGEEAKRLRATLISIRLECLRKEIRAERISQGELSELQGLADYIDPFDVELLDWAGVPEEDAMRRQEAATAKK
jgi:flagellar biosynthesis regulator FlaF